MARHLYSPMYQAVRVADVLIVGPLMMIGAHGLHRTGRPGLGIALWSMGVATIVFNGYNFWKIQYDENY